jgi:hypothetical protein
MILIFNFLLKNLIKFSLILKETKVEEENKFYWFEKRKQLKGGKTITHSKERVVRKGKIKCPSKSGMEIILKHC